MPDNNKVLKDLLCLLLLISFIKYAFDLQKYKQCNNVNSNANKKIEDRYLIHELDAQFLKSIETTENHVQTLINFFTVQDSDSHYQTTLKKLKNIITHINSKYKKNSPALALLGPIGTTSIVLKERELEKELLTVINSIGKILVALNNEKTDTSTLYQEAPTIEIGLRENHKMIGHFT